MSFGRKFFLNVCIYENMLELKGAADWYVQAVVYQN